MHAPKILPWLARKAGITDHDALDIWRRALDEAVAQAGGRVDASFSRVAVDRLVALVQSSAKSAFPAAGLSDHGHRPQADLCAG
ncbi:MAG: hypothetical protein LPJ94_00050 [Thauera sp.]|uniref:hypothetical protein n=1 Tax=Thauera sp. JM12B12 TaxID=3142262 RepID=UPI0029C52F55|nr:hypothetical protein [Thauera sp.]